MLRKIEKELWIHLPVESKKGELTELGSREKKLWEWKWGRGGWGKGG